MSDCRIVKALELIHKVKAQLNPSNDGAEWREIVATLDQVEDELLRLKVELKRAERAFPAEDPAWTGPRGL